MAQSKLFQADILIIGGGMSAVMAAIKAREAGADVLLVDKSYFGHSGCAGHASGVFAVFFPEEDDVEAWLDGWGGVLCNRQLLRKAILLTYDLVMKMDEWGVPWVKEGEKILRVGGPGLPLPHSAMMEGGGPAFMIALRAEALKRGVRVLNRVMINDLLTSDGCHPTQGKVVGAIGFSSRTGEICVFKAKRTIMCAGPWKFPFATSGKGLQGHPRDSSGDGNAAMLRAGAIMGKIEAGGGGLRPTHFWCAPALEMHTGLKAHWVNRLGEKIGEKYHLMQDKFMWRRSTINYGIAKEYIEGRGPVTIDISHYTPYERRLIKSVIPLVCKTWETGGYDLTKGGVTYNSVVAASQAVSGNGARLTDRMETSLPGLFAAGGCTDGAYMSMGQILPWCAVMGWWAGENAASEVAGEKLPDLVDSQVDRLEAVIMQPLLQKDGLDYDAVHEKLERVILEDVGYVMEGKRLERAMDKVREIRAHDLTRFRADDPHNQAKVLGLKNFAEYVEIVLGAMLRRTESRGNIVREDFPNVDNVNWLKLTVAQRQKDGTNRFWEVPAPVAAGAMKATRELHQYFRFGT